MTSRERNNAEYDERLRLAGANGASGAEPPAAKRARLIRELQSGPLKLSLKNYACADHLGESELTMCYTIADAAVKAQNKAYRATPAIVEEFLQHVFDTWDSSKGGAKFVGPPSAFVQGCYFESETPIGEIPALGDQRQCTLKSPNNLPPWEAWLISTQHFLETRNVYYGAKLITTPSPMRLELVLSLGPSLQDRLHQVLRYDIVPKVVWRSQKTCMSEWDQLKKRMIDHISTSYEAYNRGRAVQYARNLLIQRSWGGDISAANQKFEFVNGDDILCILPPLASHSYRRIPRVFGHEVAERGYGA